MKIEHRMQFFPIFLKKERSSIIYIFKIKFILRFHKNIYIPKNQTPKQIKPHQKSTEFQFDSVKSTNRMKFIKNFSQKSKLEISIRLWILQFDRIANAQIEFRNSGDGLCRTLRNEMEAISRSWNQVRLSDAFVESASNVKNPENPRTNVYRVMRCKRAIFHRRNLFENLKKPHHATQTQQAIWERLKAYNRFSMYFQFELMLCIAENFNMRL